MTQCILLAAGIDYITLSATDAGSKERMRRYYKEVDEADRELGYASYKAGGHGFVGVRNRHAYLAECNERMLLEVSGWHASRAFMLIRPSQSCARLDIQMTVRIHPDSVPAFLDAAELEAAKDLPRRGKRAEVKALHGARGNQTVYIGSKKSDKLIRLYDKYEESGEEYYRDSVRMEVQLRKKYAQAVWDYCAEQGAGVGFMLRCLTGWLNEANIPTDWIEDDWSYVRPPKPSKKKSEVRDGWWYSQVAPTIREAAAEGRVSQALRILFDGALTPHELSAILAFVAMSTGDYAYNRQEDQEEAS